MTDKPNIARLLDGVPRYCVNTETAKMERYHYGVYVERDKVLAALSAALPADTPAMSDGLKPCPFCGGDDLYFPHGTDPAVIECSGCGARSGVPDDQTEVEATAKWNARVAPSLRITGPNSDGEYWLHIKAGGRSGGINLGAEHGPICKRLLDAASETGVQE